MPTPMPAPAVLDREFLEIRAKLLELAASFDRLDRGEDCVSDDARMDLIRRGIKVLQQEQGDRAARIQMIFSRDYDRNWREDFEV